MRKKLFTYLFTLMALASFAQSPEISLREFASGQIKKGVRSIGMGGDGATWGNYALVYRDSNTALLDGGITSYPNGNTFSFTAVGVTTPALWHGLTVYAIALSQYATGISASLKPPGGLAEATHGNGTNQAIFIKSALPLGKGFSFGILLSYERSQYNALNDTNSAYYINYHTNWVPSGGLGLTWQPIKRILVGFRALFNQDDEVITWNKATAEGLNFAHEYRLGISVGLWQGALIDIGGNVRYRHNAILNTTHLDPAPNLGFEQGLFSKHLFIRGGLDESSITGGLTIKAHPFNIDMAYVYNLGFARTSNLYGTGSNSVLVTFVYAFGK